MIGPWEHDDMNHEKREESSCGRTTKLAWSRNPSFSVASLNVQTGQRGYEADTAARALLQSGLQRCGVCKPLHSRAVMDEQHEVSVSSLRDSRLGHKLESNLEKRNENRYLQDHSPDSITHRAFS